jgi:hypothetical protein
MMAMFPMFLLPTTARRSGNKGKGNDKTLSQNEGVMKTTTLRYPRPQELTVTVGIDAHCEIIDAIALEMSK